MTKWEYRWLHIGLAPSWLQTGFQVDKLETELGPEMGQLGREGWEAVGFELVGARVVVMMKRPLP